MNKEKTTAIKTDSTKKLSSNTIKDIAYIGLFTALMAVCSQIFIPTPPGVPPVTMQTFAMFLAGGLLGWKKGTLSVLIYLILGLIGLPVFSRFTGGLGVLFGMTGGYIIGFVFTTLTIGLITEKLGKKLWVLILSMVAGLLLCYTFGTAWFMVVYSNQTGPIGLWSALSLCVFPFLLFDAGKIAVAAILVNRLSHLMPRLSKNK